MFGIIAAIAGMIGVPLGTTCSYFARRYTKRGDPAICAASVFIGAIFLIFFFIFSKQIFSHRGILAYIIIFSTQVVINMNWGIVTDMGLVRLIPSQVLTIINCNTNCLYLYYFWLKYMKFHNVLIRNSHLYFT